MRRKLTVFHPMLPVNGGYTVFEGSDLRYTVETDNSLRITGWSNSDQKGNAVFAPGQWGYACMAMSDT